MPSGISSLVKKESVIVVNIIIIIYNIQSELERMIGLHKMSKANNKTKNKRSLSTTFLCMTLLPLLAFGLICAIFISYKVRETSKEQAATNLKNVAVAVENAYDAMYPGDYNVLKMKKSVTLYKGENVLSENTAFIDNIKAETGMDISVFFADLRMQTTMLDENGDRYVNVTAADKVVVEVYLDKQERFYDNVTIERVPYYAYYRPLYLSDGSCFGMIGVAIPAKSVGKAATRSIIEMIAILVAFMLVTAFIIIRSSSKIIYIIQRILFFLRELTKDNLDARLDDLVSNREDELGEIGNASVKLQLSLKKLIERDALTSLYNRRACERKLKKLESDGLKASISIGDIDFFKKFNDSFGHECGDVVLKEVAACLNEGMLGKGFVARWGGEEFLLVFEGEEEQKAGEYLNEILQSIRDRVIEYDGQTHSVTMTFGVVGHEDGETISDQIRRADDKLYEGKQGGRNRVIV